MNFTTQRDLSARSFAELRTLNDEPTVLLTAEQRDSLAARFRAIPTLRHRRLDAWAVERAGVTSNDFAWSPITARRILGNDALRHLERTPHLSYAEAVREAVADQFDRVARGHGRPGTLGAWLAGIDDAIVGIVAAEATTWATQVHQLAQRLGGDFAMAKVDAYYDVAGARTSLRGRRDGVISTDLGRVLVRFRSGMPGRTAGAGLRADVAVDALANPRGEGARRIIGIWPEAGVAIAVEGTLESVRAGARDLVRAAVVEHRQQTRIAA